MALDAKKLEQPLLKLRKLLREASRVPGQDEVHDIRTNTRRVEAVVEALHLYKQRKGRRVLKAVTPIRKSAGVVRDMDVLTGFSATLSSNGQNSCLVRLLGFLREERARGARKLRKKISKRKSETSRRLKVCASSIKKTVDKHSVKVRRDWPVDAASTALRISAELGKWPSLSTDNLHAFRLKVKELRYVLQLSGQRNALTERLGEVKDQIGEWHDWIELRAIAKAVLSDCKNCSLVSRIENTARQRFETALKSAQSLRDANFGKQGGRDARSRKRGSIKEAVLKASAELAA